MLSFIKTFFSDATSKIFLIVIAALIAIVGLLYLDRSHLVTENTNLVTQNAYLKSENANLTVDIDKKKSALDLCTKNTDDLIAQENARKKAAEEEQKKAAVEAQRHQDNRKTILLQKPTSTDDYKSSVDLMNQLLDMKANNVSKK